MTGTRAALLYDRDCGFCRWSLGLLLAWDRNRALEPVAIQSDRGAALLAGLEPERRLDSLHLLIAGERRSAGAAVAPILRLLPGGRGPAALAERAPGATDRSYRWVAEHRGRIGRAIRPRQARWAERQIRRREGEPEPGGAARTVAPGSSSRLR